MSNKDKQPPSKTDKQAAPSLSEAQSVESIQNGSGGYATSTLLAQSYAGPIPDPETLARYDQISPGSAGKIIALFETQVNHRIESEKLEFHAAVKDLSTQRSSESKGQALAFTIVMSAIVAGSLLVYSGHDWAGASIVTGAIGALATAFVVGKRYERKHP